VKLRVVIDRYDRVGVQKLFSDCRSRGVCCGGCLNLCAPGADGYLQPSSAREDGDRFSLAVLGRADDGEPGGTAEAVEQIGAFRLGGEMIQDNVECRSPGLHLDPCLGVRAQEIGDEQHDVVLSGVVRGMPVLADDGSETISVFKHRRLGFSRDVSRVDHDGLLRVVKAHSLEWCVACWKLWGLPDCLLLCLEELFEVFGKAVAIRAHLFGGRHVRQGAAFKWQ